MKITTIKTRLIVSIMVTSTVSLCIACLIYSFYELSRYKAAKENEVKQLVLYVSPLIALQLNSQDEKGSLWKSVVGDDKNVLAVTLYRDNFTLTDQYVRSGNMVSGFLPSKETVISFEGEHCFVSSPIRSNGDTIGYMVIDYFLFDKASGFRSIVIVFICNLIFASLIAYLVAHALQSKLNRSIDSLVTAARAIYIDKKYETRARKVSADEFGVLTDTINEMLDEMSSREEEMKNLNDHLESRVATRTAALQEINTRLLNEKTRADRAVSVKSDFLANMSHEIRTPMNGIVASCDLAVAEELPPKVANYLKIIQASSHTLLLIINDILDFSKLEAGTLELVSASFSLTELLNKISSVFNEPARLNNIDLSIHVDSKTPEILVGDRVRLHQILSNLIDNGIKFTHEGKVSLNIACLEKNDKDFVLECRVSDTGVGLSEDGLKSIFQSFHQVDSSSTRKFGGTGLGLAITKKLAIMMGGTIEVSSHLGEGSTFIVSVRMGWKPSSLGELPKKEEPLEQKQQTCIEDLLGCHALLAEDNETNRGIAEALLTDLGLTVDSVEDGELALQALEQTKYDFVILDMQMPVLDGYETIKQIRRQEKYKNLPIIALTAHALAGDKEKCIQAGADAYLSKPVVKNNVLQVLCRFCNSNLSESASIPQVIDKIPNMGLKRLDIEGAVRKLGVDVGIYYKVLDTFCKDYEDVEAEFTRAMEEKDLPWMQKRMHSLKGSSSTLGAEKLCRMASELDLLCKKQQFPLVHQVADLMFELNNVIIEGKDIAKEHYQDFEESDNGLILVSDEGLTDCLKALADALDESLYDQINSEFGRLETKLSGSLVVNMGKMIRMYAYDDALVLLYDICSELNISLPVDLRK